MESLVALVYVITKAQHYKRSFILPSNFKHHKTDNIGNHINIAAITKLLKGENIIFATPRKRSLNTIKYSDFKYLNYIPNPIFVSDWTSELKNIEVVKNYGVFLSGYSSNVDYSNCFLKCFRFREYIGEYMPDITIIMNKELKQFKNGFNKNIEINYETDQIIIDGKLIERKPWDIETPRDKLLLLGSGKHIKTNSLHVILLSLMIGVPVCEVFERHGTTKLSQMKDWLKKIGFRVENNKIYNYEHNWLREEKVIIETYKNLFKNDTNWHKLLQNHQKINEN